MRFTVVIGLAVLAGSAASPLAGQRGAAAPVPPASCKGPCAQARTPSPGSGGDDLRGAAASGPGDEWAVGRRSTMRSKTSRRRHKVRALLEHHKHDPEATLRAAGRYLQV